MDVPLLLLCPSLLLPFADVSAGLSFCLCPVLILSEPILCSRSFYRSLQSMGHQPGLIPKYLKTAARTLASSPAFPWHSSNIEVQSIGQGEAYLQLGSLLGANWVGNEVHYVGRGFYGMCLDHSHF